MTDSTLNPNLNTDDAEAEADLSRQSRAQQFRQNRRAQVSTALPALLMIVLGAVYLISPAELTPALALGIGVGALGVSLVARFLLNARRERGLFFIGLVVLGWVGVVAALLSRDAQNVTLTQGWPLLLMVVGLAALLTFLFERNHDRGLILPGILFIVGSGVALLFTLQLVPGTTLRVVAAYWPLVFVLIALALLPRTFREN